VSFQESLLTLSLTTLPLGSKSQHDSTDRTQHGRQIDIAATGNKKRRHLGYQIDERRVVREKSCSFFC